MLLPEVAVAVSVLALAAAVFALLVSLGTATRVTRGGAPHPLGPLAGGLASGTPAPLDRLARLLPGVAADKLAAGPTLVLFFSDGCAACRDLIDLLNQADGALDGATVVAVHKGGLNKLRERARFTAHWVADPDGGVHDGYQVVAFPSAYLLQDGQVALAAAGVTPELRRWASGEAVGL